MRLLAFAALFAAGTTFAAPVALACDCGGLELDQAVKRADVVFTAEAVDVSPTHRGEAQLEVQRVFKGTASGRVAMIGTGGNCTFHFVKGERYLVFARVMPGAKLQTNICTRTAKLTDADAVKDVAALSKK